MSRTRDRWLALQAEALERDHHRCQLGLDGCTDTAVTTVVEPAPRPSDPPAEQPVEDGATVLVEESRSSGLTLDRLVSACPACHERHYEPTPDQLLAEQLEDVADETVYHLTEYDRITGEVIATSPVSRRAVAALTVRQHDR